MPGLTASPYGKYGTHQQWVRRRRMKYSSDQEENEKENCGQQWVRRKEEDLLWSCPVVGKGRRKKFQNCHYSPDQL